MMHRPFGIDITGTTDEYRLDVITDPDPDNPQAVIYFMAADMDSACDQAARLLAAADGPDDRYGELYNPRRHRRCRLLRHHPPARVSIHHPRPGGPQERVAHAWIRLPDNYVRLVRECPQLRRGSIQDIDRSARVGSASRARVDVRSPGYHQTLRERLRSTPNSRQQESPTPRFVWRREGYEAPTSSEATIAPGPGLGALLSSNTFSACRGDAHLPQPFPHVAAQAAAVSPRPEPVSVVVGR